ncbi:MAG TPA: hypothetical protein PKY82_04110 [Pyrinomonadaceae bacterium]|nr:hypothetical protein [Pyrinomonadaceae bacterium]
MLITILITIALFIIPVSAQQTVFNVPTTDVLDKGKVYVELDASFKTGNQPALQKFSSFVPRIVVGAGKNVEVGLNVLGNFQPGSDSIIISPTVKWKFYENEKKDLAVIGGTNVYLPVRNRAYNIGTYSYLATSKSIKKIRLTAGGYVFSKNVVAPNAVRAGGQFAVEQTINSKLTLAADWLTGKHANGYFTPGIIYKPHPKVTTYWSYSIGNFNAKNGNHYFLFELGYNFN